MTTRWSAEIPCNLLPLLVAMTMNVIIAWTHSSLDLVNNYTHTHTIVCPTDQPPNQPMPQVRHGRIVQDLEAHGKTLIQVRVCVCMAG
jgi:hypothetical protein